MIKDTQVPRKVVFLLRIRSMGSIRGRTRTLLMGFWAKVVFAKDRTGRHTRRNIFLFGIARAITFGLDSAASPTGQTCLSRHLTLGFKLNI